LNDLWLKPKNSKSRDCRFSADDVTHIQLSSMFSVLKADQKNTVLFEHVNNNVKTIPEKERRKKKKCCLEVVMVETLVPCSKISWALNIKLLVFLNPLHLWQYDLAW
jgi:ribosomal protein S1